MNIDLFNFNLPESLIAQTPLTDRLGSRLLALNKITGEMNHHPFTELINYLQPGDTLVLNDTKVMPARIFGIKQSTGAKVELLLLKNLGDDRWEALVRPGKRIKPGTILLFGSSTDEDTLLTAIVEEESTMGRRRIRFTYQGIFPEILDRLGQMPLPPYIKEQLSDKTRYQTVYANEEGSAAAPTAGLHFTKDYLKEIELKGVSLAYLTLHVGLGTFRPVSAETVEQHEMHEEYYSLSAENARILNEARARKSRIIAVGTTS
ncbi:MAG TPA: tRNA preQ1(34) S-adenosylmethionine ribosyltransferase-isomerase QueA, partial [Bacilli bacterium]